QRGAKSLDGLLATEQFQGLKERRAHERSGDGAANRRLGPSKSETQFFAEFDGRVVQAYRVERHEQFESSHGAAKKAPAQGIVLDDLGETRLVELERIDKEERHHRGNLAQARDALLHQRRDARAEV